MAEKSLFSNIIHISIIGLPQAGKWKLSIAFTLYLASFFSDQYDATCEDPFRTQRIVSSHPNRAVMIELDTFDRELTDYFEPGYYRPDAVVLVYDITARGSFHALDRLYRLYTERLLGPKNVLTLVMGAKADLSGEAREIRKEEGRELAERLGHNP